VDSIITREDKLLTTMCIQSQHSIITGTHTK